MDAPGNASQEPGTGAFLPSVTLPTNNLTRYMRIRMGVDDGVLNGEVPRTLLGILPLGTRRITAPIEEVRGVSIARSLDPLGGGAAAALILLPWFVLPWWAATLLLIVGLWVLAVAWGPKLSIVTTGGKRHTARICFGHELDGELFAEALNRTAAEARDA